MRTLKIARTIDRINLLVGRGVSLLVACLVGIVAIEVLFRNSAGGSPIWSYDLAYMVFGAIFMLGAAETLRRGGHLRVDMWWNSFSPRTKGWIDLIGYLLLFMPVMITLFLLGYDEAYRAFLTSERGEQTPWRPLLWPMKSVVPLAALLLTAQGVSEILKSIALIRGDTLPPKESP